MSRLRRLVPSDRYFFVTCKVLPERNPVKRGMVTRPEEWRWSSVHDYTGTPRQPAGTKSVLPVDRVLLPADERARI